MSVSSSTDGPLRIIDLNRTNQTFRVYRMPQESGMAEAIVQWRARGVMPAQHVETDAPPKMDILFLNPPLEGPFAGKTYKRISGLTFQPGFVSITTDAGDLHYRLPSSLAALYANATDAAKLEALVHRIAEFQISQPVQLQVGVIGSKDTTDYKMQECLTEAAKDQLAKTTVTFRDVFVLECSNDAGKKMMVGQTTDRPTPAPHGTPTYTKVITVDEIHAYVEAMRMSSRRLHCPHE